MRVEQSTKQKVKGPNRRPLSGLDPTHLQLPQVPGPGEEARGALGVLQQEPFFLDSEGTR